MPAAPPRTGGRDFRTDTGPGVFGAAVDPGTPASGFRSLHYDVGCPVDILLDGPPFEMEDHRNWSDPGWKSYCPPLGAPQPLHRPAGEEIAQSVTVRGRPSAVPSISAFAAGPGSVALVGRGPEQLTAGATLLAGRAGLRRVAVFDPETHTTAPGSAELVRSVLRGLGSAAPVGGGSRAHLAELNRLDEIGDWDFCTFPITAQAHHRDDASILGTPRAMPAMIATVRRIAPGLPIVVGPLAFRPRVGANSPAAPGDPPDDRETGPLGATFLLAAVLGLRGADALEVLLAPGPVREMPGGLRETRGGLAGALLERIGVLSGRPYVDLPTGRTDVLAATVLGGPAPVTLVANLGADPAEVLGTVVAGRDHLITEQG